MKGDGQRLQDRLTLYGTGWKGLSSQFWAAPDLGWRYPEMMKISYQVIQASVPLLETARDRAVLLAADDAVAAGLVPYLEHHILEERGHDDWLKADLASVGVFNCVLQ